MTQPPKQLWNDVTSYSRGDKDRTPRAWEARFGRFKLSVRRHAYYEPDAWLASCGDLFYLSVLKSGDIEDAKQEAVDLLRKMLEVAMNEIQDVTKEGRKKEKNTP